MGQQGWGAQWGWGWWGGGDWGAQRCPHPIGPPRVLIPPPHVYPIASPTFPPPHPLLPPPIYPPRAAPPPPPFSPSAPQRPPPAPHGVPWPRSGPWGADVQHGGGGHREGRRAAAPHPAALPALPDIERYSDKYQLSSPIDGAIEWNPDWRRFPRELKIRVRRLRKGRSCAPPPRTAPRPPPPDKEETIKKLEHLEKKEEEVTSEEEEKEEEEEGEGRDEEGEEYDEEEHEEETDYIMSYFDNGEDFGADSDDNGDEAVY
uniref:RNA polymerase III subunit GL n=1 Tax=Gallus gallus TaxID=9031 RepID=A0A8V1AFA5_CHICK